MFSKIRRLFNKLEFKGEVSSDEIGRAWANVAGIELHAVKRGRVEFCVWPRKH